jgi:threonine dehydratase
MGAISRPEVEKARERIAGFVRRTPVLELPAGLRGRAHPLALKLELHQYTGSFKPRGAFHRLLGEAIPAAGVVAASGGNHGAAVAFAASRLGVPVRVFMPTTTPRAKVQRVRRYGAEVVLTGDIYADAKAAAERYAVESGALDVPAYDDPAVVAGQGTMALEFMDQASFDTLLVAVGGGGLAAGCAAALAGRNIRIVGVETTGTRSLHAALEAGMPVDVQVSGLAADSLGARRVGEVPFAILRAAAERVVLVEDADLRAAQEALWDECRVLAEPGGAAALAAWLSGSYRATAGERLGIVICGGNVDPASMAC